MCACARLVCIACHYNVVVIGFSSWSSSTTTEVMTIEEKERNFAYVLCDVDAVTRLSPLVFWMLRQKSWARVNFVRTEKRWEKIIIGRISGEGILLFHSSVQCEFCTSSDLCHSLFKYVARIRKSCQCTICSSRVNKLIAESDLKYFFYFERNF